MTQPLMVDITVDSAKNRTCAAKIDKFPSISAPRNVESRCDYYGFKQPTQWISLEEFIQFERQYQPVLDWQTRRWNLMLTEQGWPPLESPKLKLYVRKGIPRCHRAEAWMRYSGAKKYMEENKGLYASLLKLAENLGEHNEHSEIIDCDLHRTFPDNAYFECTVKEDTTVDPGSNPRLSALRRILLAFSLCAPHIGYCQSLNYLAGIFLLVIQDEESAFWMLVTTIQDFFPEDILMMLVYERLPDIWTKLSGDKNFWECIDLNSLPNMTLITNHWFLTLFINVLPIETALRIWDCFFIEGSNVLFKVALTIIQMNEQAILALQDPADIFPKLTTMPKRLLDCHRFIDRVFSNDIGKDITTTEIERHRVLFRERSKQQNHKA
ncbi:hypothetical protein VTP01DRAFT_1596 [Rhizomucor pusillus]|uniref:uncharacterized protein n=1 Tax=Rhizomucor pusillus TaxID=4840 RepID=UPI00374388B9